MLNRVSVTPLPPVVPAVVATIAAVALGACQPVPPPKAFLVRFADSGIELELGFWIEDPEAGIIGIKSDINLAIWRAFRREGIEIPYPQSALHLRSVDRKVVSAFREPPEHRPREGPR